MAFPTVNDADTTSGTQTSNSSSWTGTYPANIAAGNLLLMFVAADGAGAASATGWTRIDTDSGTGNVAVTVLGKVADGSETGTFTITISANEQGGWRIFRITDWFGGSLVADSSSLGVDATVASGTDQNPNPPSLDPANWEAADTLWFAACAIDTSRTISVYPLAGRNTADTSGGAGGATLGLCTTTSAASSLDPGTFTASNSDDWSTATVAVRPSGFPPIVNVAPYIPI